MQARPDRQSPQLASSRSDDAPVLLVTDDRLRGERLARDLGLEGIGHIHELYEDEAVGERLSVVLCDVKALTSDAILRLRRLLNAPRAGGVPSLFLLHDGGPRTAMQAGVLGATRTLSAFSTPAALAEALQALAAVPVRPPGLAVRRQAEEALGCIEATFDGTPPPQALVETGTDLISRAVMEAGIRDWVLAVQRFDGATHRHILLIAGLAAAFAGTLGLRASDRHLLTRAALLHDVGKTRIPLAILNKAGALTPAEQTVMRTHAAAGETLLAAGGYAPPILAVARSHHEMLDGSGYPDGLRGTQIPDLVRLVSVCDVYGALIERRPYKAASTPGEALAALGAMRGRLDGDLVRAFRPVADSFAASPARVGAPAASPARSMA